MSGYISDLDDTYPDGSVHKVFVLDDDLKDLKAKIKDTFPNVTGQVTATHTELNYLSGMNSNVQSTMDSMNARAVNQAALGQVYAGRVALDGSATSLPSGWTSSSPSTGVYLVTHNMGGAANIPMLMIDANVTPNSHRIKGSLTSITSNSFTAQYYNLDTSGLVGAGFYFHLHHIT